MNPQTQNPYPYALNNPVNRVDPTGLASEGSEGGFSEAFFEELLFQDCIKFVLVTFLLAILAVGFLGLPAFAGVGGTAGVIVAGVSTVNFLAASGAAAGVGYSDYEVCTARFSQATR